MPVDIEAHLHNLSVQIDRLKVLYEQYFIGIEKGPPTVARRESEKLLDSLGRQNIGNTAVRFRYLTLMRRWKTYAERWDKVLREIENGTYSKHRARVARIDQLRAAAAERERPPPTSVPTTDGEADAAPSEPQAAGQAPAAEAAATPSARAATSSTRNAPPPAVPGMSESDLRALHQKYVEARRAAGDPKAEVRYEALVSTLQKQLPDILARNRCNEVSFNVVLRDGKVILKAQPKR